MKINAWSLKLANALKVKIAQVEIALVLLIYVPRHSTKVAQWWAVQVKVSSAIKSAKYAYMIQELIARPIKSARLDAANILPAVHSVQYSTKYAKRHLHQQKQKNIF